MMGYGWMYLFVALIAALTVSLVDAQPTTQPPPSNTTVPPTTQPIPTNDTDSDDNGPDSRWEPVAGIAIGFLGGFLILAVILMAVLSYLRPQQ